MASKTVKSDAESNPLLAMLEEGGLPIYDAEGRPADIRQLCMGANDRYAAMHAEAPASEVAAAAGDPAASPAPPDGAAHAAADKLEAFDPSDVYVGLYFSAHWCPPCRAYTPQLVDTYRALKTQGRHFEVVFCSMDQKITEFTSYAGSMPWWRLPFRDRRVSSMASVVGAHFIPTLAVYRARDGKLVNANAKTQTAALARFPWPGSTSGVNPLLQLAAVACRCVVFLVVIYFIYRAIA